MAAWKCGWCGERASMNPMGNGYAVSRTAPKPRPSGHTTDADLYCTMQCANCDAHSIARIRVKILDHKHAELRSEMTSFWQHRDPEEAHPQHVEGKDFDYVPMGIGRSASEAYKCHSIAAYRAACLMARTTIEAAANDKEIEGKDLLSQIDGLAKAGWILPRVQNSAHKVRMFGNDMAHGDIEHEVTPNESQDVLRLMTVILQNIYEIDDVTEKVDASVADRRAQREA